MDYRLHLQDPTAGTPTYLFEEVVAAASTATQGRALFAFASRDGVDALLEDPEIVGLLRRGTFELVVGVDAVTTRPALERLLQASRKYRSFRPLVFWNDTGRLFHPKMCFFAGNRNAIEGALKSLSSVIREAGEDPDAVFAEIADERTKLAKLGITVAPTNGQQQAPIVDVAQGAN